MLIALAVASSGAHAEEGGSGHYMTGSIASFMDGVAPTETFLLRVNLLNYDGSVQRDQPLPMAGVSTLGAKAKSTAFGLTAFWRPSVEIGEGWSYAMSATIPYVWMEVTANVNTGGGASAGVRSKVDGLGDIVLMPLMLNQNINPDFNINYRVAFYAPTGNYEVGRLANTGKNYWSVEPTVGFMYMGQKNGIEASVFMGTTFNRTNSATDYKSGTQFHIDSTFAQHFPFAGGLAGVGMNLFYYKQITDDSGSGATFGGFRGKTLGLGPALSYATKVNGKDTIGELKWIHENATENRLSGDAIWLKVLHKF